jgi:hypothetical protein
MIQITPQMRIVAAVEPADFRLQVLLSAGNPEATQAAPTW